MKYPAGIRELIIKPVLENNINIPLTCNTPLVDAVLMESQEGYVIPLSNYTLQPIDNISLNIKTTKDISSVESARQGSIKFTYSEDSSIDFSLPLMDTDIVKIYFKAETSIPRNTVDEKVVIVPNLQKSFRINLVGNLSVYTMHGAKIKEIKKLYKRDGCVCIRYPNRFICCKSF